MNFDRIKSLPLNTLREFSRLYHSYPTLFTAIIGGLATCCLLGVAILQEKEIKKNIPLPNIPVPRLIEVPSPNRDPRPGFGYVNTVVIHIVEADSPQSFHRQLRSRRSRYSLHYSIAPDGTLYSHVAESDRAWHTKIGYLPTKVTQVNAFSLAIGLIHTPGHPPKENQYQLRTLRALLQQSVKRYVIRFVATASQVSRDVRTDYLDAEFPFDQFDEYKPLFIFPLPGSDLSGTKQ